MFKEYFEEYRLEIIDLWLSAIWIGAAIGLISSMIL